MQFPAPDSFDRHAECPVRGRPLDEIERRAVHLGRADADRGDRGPTRFPRLQALLSTLTGVRPLQPLAEQRLETLRRFASATRRGDGLARRFAAELQALGFSPDAIRTATVLAGR